jgi:FAD/FMN-containing dehydrogenase
VSDIVEILRRELGDKTILSRAEVALRATSYWDNSPMKAKALIRPRTTQDVSAALKICHHHNQPVITQGGNTSCVQGTQSGDNDIILSLERMNKIVDIDPLANTATLEAGVILENAQNAVHAKGLFLPLDLGARGSCTIGGNMATNAGGINVLRYGMARAIVLGLEAVLADGTIISSMNKMLKNNAGYDLKQLFIGSEGTLGIITQVVIRLMPLSTTKNTALVALPDFAAVSRLLTHLKSTLGTNLSAFEVMWGEYFHDVTRDPEGQKNEGHHTTKHHATKHRAPMDRTHPFYVLYECDGNDPARDDARFMEVIEAAFADDYILDAVIPKSDAERQALWAIRDDFDAILQPKPVYLYDVSLPISAMESYVRDVNNALRELLPQSKSYVFGHIGDGNLHLFVHPHSQDPQARHLSDRALYEPLKTYHGSVSAEHGIGVEKKAWLGQSRSAAEISLMKLLKTSLDPKKILNAGIVID